MRDLFYPDSIAVFGVSESKDNFGRNIVKNLLDFQYDGKIFPVGRSSGKVYGLRIYENIDEIQEKIDLAVFLIPAKHIPVYFEACAKKGVKRMIVSSGGFSELAGDRADIEQKILDLAEEYDVRFLGPNCIAMINQDNGICLPFVRMRRFEDGPVTVMTQSGGVGLSLINMFTGQNLGINKYVSLGNKLNIDESDLVNFLKEDESTGILCFYLEEIEHGKRLMEAVRGCEKPVVILKSNVEPETAKVANSHTAAVANDDRVVDAALRQCGVTRVREMEELTPICKAFTLPPIKGNRVAIITPTGGFAVILADMCAKYGFELPPYPEAFLSEVSTHVRAGVIKLSNPLDLGDMFDVEMVAHTVTQAMKQPEFDALILSWIILKDIGVGVSAVNIFPQIERMMKKFGKPVILSLVGDPTDIAHMRKTTKFPVFSSPEESIKALAAMRDFHTAAKKLRTQEPVRREIDAKGIRAIIDKRIKEEGKEIGGATLDILAACGIPVAETALCATKEEAVAKAESFGGPVAMKLSAKGTLHKTEIGGVTLGINGAEACAAAYEKMMGSAKKVVAPDAIDGVLVQKMITGGRELVAGINKNSSFEHIVVFGMGGIYVEALKEVAMRVAPLGEMDAEALLNESAASKIIDAFRGMKPADRNQLKDVFYRLSELATAFPEIKELDINPLILTADGEIVAVDARMVVE